MRIGIILSAGKGQRFGGSTPKQYCEINKREVIEYTVSAFQNSPLIDRIIIVCSPEWTDHIKGLKLFNDWDKVSDIIPGGKERYNSSLNALALCNDDDVLLFHDAVRPFITEDIIERNVRAIEDEGFSAADTAINVADTIIKADSDGCISSVPFRPELRSGQTPQTFICSTIRDAYSRALEDPGFKTTDDCSIVVKYSDKKVKIVEGDVRNIKVTYPQDLSLAEVIADEMYGDKVLY